jgi:hypothetical protein
MREAVGAVGAAGLFADRVEVRVPQILLHAVEVAELDPFLGDPFGKAGMTFQYFATDTL